MARVTLTMSAGLTNPEVWPERLAEAARLSVDEVLEIHVAAIAQDPTFPVGVTGHARQGLSHTPARRVGTVVTGSIVIGGPAAAYAEPLEKGRSPDRKRPPADRIRRWLEVVAADRVEAVAQHLRAQYLAAHPTHRRAGGPGVAKFRARALWLLTRALQARIARDGIAGRRMVGRRRPAIEADLLRTLTRNLQRVLGGGA